VIKQIASCPYCRQGEVAFDCDTLELVLNPDQAGQQACEHLVCVSAFGCREELLPDGARRVGFANLDWRRPGLNTVSPDELHRRLECGMTAAGVEEQAPHQLACRLTPIQLEVGRYLSRAETVRWLDRVGWEKAEGELPYGECRLEGWVGFARRWPELLGSSSPG
jgi:hypothetical protein